MAEITIEGRRYLIIRCARCSHPMIAQEDGNTHDNDKLEVCPRCTRDIWMGLERTALFRDHLLRLKEDE